MIMTSETKEEGGGRSGSNWQVRWAVGKAVGLWVYVWTCGLVGESVVRCAAMWADRRSGTGFLVVGVQCRAVKECVVLVVR